MNYYSLVHPNGFQVFHSPFEKGVQDVPFEGGLIEEPLPNDRTIDIECATGKNWDDIIPGAPGDRVFYFSERARSLIQQHGFSGIDFHRSILRKINVPKIMRGLEVPQYWCGRITGHLKSVAVKVEGNVLSPHKLDHHGVRFILEKTDTFMQIYYWGQLSLQNANLDFIQPVPVWFGCLLVSERVVDKFKESCLTGYKLNPIQSDGWCRL